MNNYNKKIIYNISKIINIKTKDIKFFSYDNYYNSGLMCRYNNFR